MVATIRETRAFTSRDHMEKMVWAFQNDQKNVNFRRALIFKKTFIAASSEACALTPSKCFAEEFKHVQNWSEKKKLIWFHFYVLAYGI